MQGMLLRSFFRGRIQANWRVNPFLMVLLTVTGCGRNSDAPPAVTVKEAPVQVRQAFSKASTPDQKAAEEVGQAVSDGAYDVALGRISSLGIRPDLTPEQRTALAQSRVAVMIQLQQAAAAGDAKAQQIIEEQRVSK